MAEFARATNVPVINGGDGPGEHPSQALLDLYTIQREFSRLGKIVDGAHIALVGDLKYGRTVHSLVKLLALYRGIKFTLISPPMLEMPGYIIEQISRNGHVIEQTHDLTRRACAARTWCTPRASRKSASPTNRSKATRRDFQINQALMDSVCGPDTLIMHPLPRDSRPGANDLSVDLNHDSRLAIFRQTDNGIPVRMAIFAVLLGVEKLVQHSMRDAAWRAAGLSRSGRRGVSRHRLISDAGACAERATAHAAQVAVLLAALAARLNALAKNST